MTPDASLPLRWADWRNQNGAIRVADVHHDLTGSAGIASTLLVRKYERTTDPAVDHAGIAIGKRTRSLPGHHRVCEVAGWVRRPLECPARGQWIARDKCGAAVG